MWAADRPGPAGQRAAEEALPVQSEARCVAIIAPTGASLAVTAGSMIQQIAGRGHSVYCFSPAFDRNSEAFLQRMQVRLGDLPAFRQGLSPIADQRTVMRLLSAFKDLKPSAVVGYSAKAAALAGLSARLAGVPRIVAVIGELGRGFVEAPERASIASRRFQKSLLRLAFRLCDTAVFLNEENHKLLQRHKVLSSRLRQFPVNGSGVDLRMFPQTQLAPLDRGVIFLYAAPLDTRLGIQDYCDAARALRAKSGHYKCLVLGPEVRGPYGFPLSELKRYRDVVQYLGPQPDPRPYMARAHAIVLPARGDTIPKSLVEAIAMGRPVITSTSRGCRAAVREGSNGMLVPPGDPTALALAMARLLLRPDLIPSMARASRELAESQFDCRRINAQLLDALDLV